MRGAKNAKPPIDSETQIPSLEVICVIFTATQANRSSFGVDLMSKRKHLQALAHVRNYCIAEFGSREYPKERNAKSETENRP